MNSSREMSTMKRPTIIYSGECSFAERIPSGQCENIAKKYLINYTRFEKIENTTNNWPSGCFLKGGVGGELIENTQRYPSVTECSSNAPCICMGEMREVIQRYNKKCNRKGLAEDDCKPAAINLGLSFTGMDPPNISVNHTGQQVASFTGRVDKKNCSTTQTPGQKGSVIAYRVCLASVSKGKCDSVPGL